jgi:hypothetical protein
MHASLCYKFFMRPGILRFWLTCFLMVMLSVKGFATGIQVNCHKAPVSVTSTASQHENHHAPRHDHQNTLSTSAHATPDGAAAHATPDGAATHTQTSVSAADLKCSQCSPCCVPAALPAPVTLHISTAPQAHGLVQPAHTPPLVIAARLERPPRNLA